MHTEQPRPHTKYIVSTIYLMQICEFFFRATYHLDSIHYRIEELCRGPTSLPRVKYRVLDKESFAESQRSAKIGSRQSLCRELDSRYKQNIGKASTPQTAQLRRHLCREPAVRLSAKYFSLPRASVKALGKNFFGFLLPNFFVQPCYSTIS
jgi:hypothetical protein